MIRRSLRWVLTQSGGRSQAVIIATLLTSSLLYISLHIIVPGLLAVARRTWEESTRSSDGEQLRVSLIVSQNGSEVQYGTFSLRASSRQLPAHLPPCPQVPSQLANTSLRLKVPLDTRPVQYLTLRTKFDNLLQLGGSYSPPSCRPPDKTAIIIPYRDRRRNLLILLHNLLPFLVKQQLDFTVFLVEQTEDYPFNRCALLNVGFLQSLHLANFTCFFIHDTDYIPRYYHNLYRCDTKPQHFAISRSDKPFYGLSYPQYIGGVLSFRRRHFQAINGCPNVYYGWGYEDDDLYIRFRKKGLVPVRYQPQFLGEYEGLGHTRQPVNQHKHELLRNVAVRMGSDGLNSVQYWLEDFEQRELYTWLLVRLPPPPPLYNHTSSPKSAGNSPTKSAGNSPTKSAGNRRESAGKNDPKAKSGKKQ